MPAFATLAAFALPTFRRSVAALIDWFTLLFFSGCGAHHLGDLDRAADRRARQAGGQRRAAGARLRAAASPGSRFVFALAATIAWAWLVRWRTGRHRAALWKTLVLPAGGAALCWLLLMTLWLPALDYARSYAPQVRAISRADRPAGLRLRRWR